MSTEAKASPQAMEQARQRIEELSRVIERHRFLYYVLDRPEIPDAEFDKLFHELERLEKEFPDLALPASPTQKVGAAPSTEFAQVKHRIPMLSLANAMNADELEKWGERVQRGLRELDIEQKVSFVCELKIDGLSIALTYKKGRFVEGATRGNGEVGEDVTPNLRTIAALPENLKPIEVGGKKLVPELVEVRGEVYFPISSFTALNKALEDEGEACFANPRNAGSGSLRQKDPRKTAQRKLGLWVYFIYITDPEFKERTRHFDNLDLLEAMGFPVEPNRFHAATIDDVIEFTKRWDEERHKLDYQTDGVVVKVNERDLWPKLGATAHSPRWAIAFKYPPEEAETQIEAINFDVGRTGAVTPVAFLSPVHLAGTTVKRATLHNAEQIKRLDVRVGDTVLVRKAGEIIPEVLSVKVDRRPADSQPFVYPTTCPICHSALERTGQEVVFRCPNIYGCPAQIQRRLVHWVGRDAMDIDGVGESLIDQLTQHGLVHDPADLYKLTEDELLKLERMGKKSAQNILAALSASKCRPLPNLIFALGIRHVGAAGAELLAERFGSVDRLVEADAQTIAEIEGIGSKIAAAVVEYFAQEPNQKLLDELRAAGINMAYAESERRAKVAQTLVGKTFVLTGTLENMERSDAEKSIKARGGKISSAVSKKTDYVVVGASPGSKLARAQELGITVIDEAELQKLFAATEDNQ